MRKRILFVDDDESVMDSLRTRLRNMPGQWVIDFVDSGARAVETLERECYDVIVSDVCLPGGSGVQLLRTVCERWPGTVRIALSGYSSPVQGLQLASVAHQFVAKPCEAPLLESTIERCLALRDLLRRPELLAVVGRMRRLPALSQTYISLREAFSLENVTSQQVAQIIASDPVVAAKVLQMANSAFFLRGRRISSIDEAVSYLGFSFVRALVLSAEVFSHWAAGSTALNLELLQYHCQVTAAVAQTLAFETPFRDDALLAGLLHDIGYWVLAQELPDELMRAKAWAIENGIPMHEAERETIGASHAEIGGYLLGIWGLPYPVVEAVVHHHAPMAIQQTRFDVLAVLAAAHVLATPGDAIAFPEAVPTEPALGADYLELLQAPITWAEAERRAASVLETADEAADE